LDRDGNLALNLESFLLEFYGKDGFVDVFFQAGPEFLWMAKAESRAIVARAFSVRGEFIQERRKKGGVSLQKDRAARRHGGAVSLWLSDFVSARIAAETR
jgi:hypothetical protein